MVSFTLKVIFARRKKKKKHDSKYHDRNKGNKISQTQEIKSVQLYKSFWFFILKKTGDHDPFAIISKIYFFVSWLVLASGYVVTDKVNFLFIQ